MAQPTFPGVFIREVSSGVRTITGVATSVAAFVGMAKNGPVNTPTQVFGFTDYSRVFSDDASLGEMSDQVRQFFQNGGQQAIVVRIAHESKPGTVALKGAAGGTVLTLTAKNNGLAGNELRAAVDYNTSSPERTFNLTLYRETFDASGKPQQSSIEVHKDLGMNPNGDRFVEAVLAQNSALATGEAATFTPAIHAVSVAARPFVDAAAAEAAIHAAVLATGPGNTGTQGHFRIKVGTSAFMDITVLPADTLGTIQGNIQTQLAAQVPGVTVSVAVATGFLRFEASVAGHDVILDRGASLDIAGAVGLGVPQGGIEIGTFANARPLPSGLVAVLSTDEAVAGSATDLARLGTFAALAKTDVATVSIAGTRPFTGTPTYAAGTNMSDGTVTSVPSLRNVRESLAAIAAALTNADFRAEVHGYRLVITPKFGDSSTGPGLTLTSTPAPTNIGAGVNLFGGVVGRAVAAPFASGLDGDPPTLADYQAAFDEIAEKVDLFNLLVLPRTFSTPAPAVQRADLWGPASTFCDSERAFLLIDADQDTNTFEEIEQEVVNLRAGIVKDHSALYWPRVEIVDKTGAHKLIDPSGSVAGVMARIDGSRGVWKAPAGLEADVRGILAVETKISDAQQGVLNPLAANVIRVFPNGIVVWGARTMDGFDNSGNDDFKYVPVRRFELFIEESLSRGLKFAVFEPNDERLWAQIRLAAGAFMNNLFRQGAFAGKTARDAYFVKVDSETTTQNDINLGIVNVVVGFAPLKPAEFIIVTIQQTAGQVQV